MQSDRGRRGRGHAFLAVLASLALAGGCGSRSALIVPDARTARDGSARGDRPRFDVVRPKQGCQTDSDCKLIDDCCSCSAIAAWLDPQPCPSTCAIPRCANWGIQEPSAYCIEMHCQLADRTPNSCMTPDDCVLHDDCCYCMALPKGAHPPPCAADCNLSRCEADGHVTGKTCHGGICRLVTVD